MATLRNIAMGCSLLMLLACRSGPSPPLTERSVPQLLQGRDDVGRVAVSADTDLLSPAQQELLRRHEAAPVLRQSVLDWLDARGRFDRAGQLALLVKVRSVRLRPEFVALLLGRLAGADHLETSVSVEREGELVKTFAASVSSSAGGRDWRDPAERLRRMARILGRRVVDGL